ncbi:MAG: cell division protein FtsZ, partial [Burkholderiales bacterium]
MGMAMMGSAHASGVDRARIAAEEAVASPLLEGVNLSGARGVLVNITASEGLKMREVNEVMNTIRGFAAEDATIIFGAVYDEEMAENLRVTVVATGLGPAKAAQKPQLVVHQAQARATGTDGGRGMTFGSVGNAPAQGHENLDIPAVIRTRRAAVEALQQGGMDHLDIPAFLRKQAD